MKIYARSILYRCESNHRLIESIKVYYYYSFFIISSFRESGRSSIRNESLPFDATEIIYKFELEHLVVFCAQ